MFREHENQAATVYLTKQYPMPHPHHAIRFEFSDEDSGCALFNTTFPKRTDPCAKAFLRWSVNEENGHVVSADVYCYDRATHKWVLQKIDKRDIADLHEYLAEMAAD